MPVRRSDLNIAGQWTPQEEAAVAAERWNFCRGKPRQTSDWMAKIHEQRTAAHTVIIVTPACW